VTVSLRLTPYRTGRRDSVPSRDALEAMVRAEAIASVQLPPPLALATAAAAATHPEALVAFRRPLLAADRREYQLWVRLHGQSGRLGEAVAGHHGRISLHLKARGCPPHS